MSEPETPSAPFYVTGGTLKPGAPSYVERRADTELAESLLGGEFCYVLTARQMGKSSLMARTAKRLEQEGACTAIVDLSQVGTERGGQAASQWYFGIAHEIHRQLRIAEPLRSWWLEGADLPPVQRLTGFFRDLVLKHCPGRVVIFVDEIDSTIGLPFADDFFAALRACFNARATDASFERLTFALFGVASPDQLIRDQARTPFNIGKRIDLTDFTVGEAAKLSVGLHADPVEASKRLDRIFSWTGGHPYLTQAVCRTVRERGAPSEGTIEESVDPWVEDLFLSSRAQREETNLKHTRARLEQPGPDKRRLLRLYRRVRQGQPVPDQPASPLFSQLKLAGVVKVTDAGQLVVRNRIYERVFTSGWAKSAMPADRGRQAAWATVAASFLSALIWYGWFQPQQAEEAFRAAIQDDGYNSAVAAYNDLRSNPFSRSRATDLMQRFWEHRGLKFALAGERDESLLSYLQALRLRDGEGLRRRAQNLVDSDYDRLKRTLRHSRGVNAVAFSPDGRSVVTGSEDRTARLWDARTGKPISPHMRHDNSVTAVAFSPDGRSVVTGSGDQTARLWDARTGEPISPPMRHKGLVTAVAFSPDGQSVVTGSGDRTTRLWDARTGKPISPPIRHESWVTAVAFSPDSRSVVTGTFKTAHLWDARTGKPISPFMPHEGLVTAVAFSPDSRSVVTGTFKTARLWDARTGKPISPLMPHEGLVTAVAFSPDGLSVITGSGDQTARLWDARTGKPISPPMQHEGWVTAVAFSPDGLSVVTGSDDQTACLWEARTGKPISPPMQSEGLVTAVAFSPDGRSGVTGSDDRTAHLWDARTGKPISLPMQHEGRVTAVAFSPDGQSVVTGSDDRTARLWDARTGKPISPPMQHEGSVTAVAFSPDGQSVVTGSDDRTARLWDARTGKPISPPMQHEGRVIAVAFNSDGRSVVTGSDDRTARLWDARTGKSISPPMQHELSVTAVVFSPDGRSVVTGSLDNSARLWEARTGKLISPLLQHQKGQNEVSAVAFSPDGKRLFVATSYWLNIYSWDGKNAVPQNSQLLHGYWKNAFHFSSDCQHCLQVALGETGNSLKIETLNLDEPSDPLIQGDPKELLEKWQKRLGLKFDEKMDLVPGY